MLCAAAGPEQAKLFITYPFTILQCQLYWCLSTASCLVPGLLAKVARCDVVDGPAIETTDPHDPHDEALSALKEDPNYDHTTGLLTLATRRPSSLLITDYNLTVAGVHPENRQRSYTYTPPGTPKIDDAEIENSMHRARRHTTTSLLPSVLDELRSKFNHRQQQEHEQQSSSSPVSFIDSNNDNVERPELTHQDSADFRPTVYQERHGITCAPAWWKKTQRKVSKACKLIAGTDDPTEAWDRFSNAIDRKAQHAVERVKDHVLHRDDSQSQQSIPAPAPAPNNSATDKVELQRSMSRSSITSSESSMSDERASLAPSSGKTKRLVAKIAEKARSHKSGTWGKRRGTAE
ncbi:hypothetical protein BC937DRAFT_94407 [Endogone sp. FLAS-F59071]|nr:hypothetical protein BC937DRAFT_94407 [Endogone sp. FLAS-F59071]|eukprot:RUS14063.1 hypothetical protein BC937DRAFT_94407 [Endogone sp. FLAS-F59071]